MVNTVKFKGEEFKTLLEERYITEVRASIKPSSHSYADRIFGTKSRITFPVDLDVDANLAMRLIQSTPDYEMVNNFLQQHNYSITDYDAGICQLRGDGRDFKIGRILNRYDASEEIKAAFMNGESRAAAKQKKQNLSITISRNPYDIAAMSTKRGWSSCMDLSHGCNRSYVFRDIRYGTMIAYLHRTSDVDIMKPICRILMKPYRVAKSRLLRDRIVGMENRPYGTDVAGFKTEVQKWIDASFPIQEDKEFTLNQYVYNDGIQRVIIRITDDSPLITSKDYKDRVKAAKYGSDAIRLRLIEDNSESVVKTAFDSMVDHRLRAKAANSKFKSIWRYAIRHMVIDCEEDRKNFLKFVEGEEALEFERELVKKLHDSEAGIEIYTSKNTKRVVNYSCRHGNDALLQTLYSKYSDDAHVISEIVNRCPHQVKDKLDEYFDTDNNSKLYLMVAGRIAKVDEFNTRVAELKRSGPAAIRLAMSRSDGREALIEDAEIAALVARSKRRKSTIIKMDFDNVRNRLTEELRQKIGEDRQFVSNEVFADMLVAAMDA